MSNKIFDMNEVNADSTSIDMDTFGVEGCSGCTGCRSDGILGADDKA